VLATYTLSDALWAIGVFLIWIGFIGVGIWLLIRLFRNKNFIPDDRVMRIFIKVVLAVFTVFVPLLGVPVLLVIWYVTRSADKPDEPRVSSQG
jgi:hypothetical protein